MKVVFVNEAGVHRMLPMAACVPLMRDALATLARGDALLPLRGMVWLPDRSGLLGMMPAYLGAPRSFGFKVVSVMPGNHGTGYDSHQGVVMLFGLEHGEPLAILDATAITAIRTAAASGAATAALAREDAGDLAILGAGAQGCSHLEAMAAVRNLRRVRVWSRTPANAERLVREAGHLARSSSGGPVPIEVVATAEAAVRGADPVCTTTSSREPVLRGEWLCDGALVCADSLAPDRAVRCRSVRQLPLFGCRRDDHGRSPGDRWWLRLASDRCALAMIMLDRACPRPGPCRTTRLAKRSSTRG